MAGDIVVQKFMYFGAGLGRREAQKQHGCAAERHGRSAVKNFMEHLRRTLAPPLACSPI